MLYLELALCKDDYLTEKEYKLPRRIRNFCWKIKCFSGIILKKNVNGNKVYVIPKINKKYINKILKLIKINGCKSICISNELFYKDEFIESIKKTEIDILDGKWILKFLLCNILDYIFENENVLLEKEIAFLVNDDYELILEYIKILGKKVKLITIITDKIKIFQKIEEIYLKNEGININVVNNYRKSLNKTDIIVNIDFSEKEIKKYKVYNRSCFINLYNEYEINDKNFDGTNITNARISMPDKYLEYVELYYNFEYLIVYESFVKKKTSYSNIFKEIEKDDVNIISLENKKGMVKLNIQSITEHL